MRSKREAAANLSYPEAVLLSESRFYFPSRTNGRFSKSNTASGVVEIGQGFERTYLVFSSPPLVSFESCSLACVGVCLGKAFANREGMRLA